MKPQTERQLDEYLTAHGASVDAFLLCAAQVLEEQELEILFAPLFTPTLDERAEVSDVLFHWRPGAADLEQLVVELAAEVPHAVVRLPDGSEAKLTLHEVMVDRYVRLLRLEHAPNAAVSASLREVLPAELWPLTTALLCERGMTPHHQAWFVSFINHVAARHELTPESLRTAVDFIAGQPSLETESLAASAEALARATQRTTAYATGGHAYWSPDVAQHHQYRGQGHVDVERVRERQAELARVDELVEDIKAFAVASAENV